MTSRSCGLSQPKITVFFSRHRTAQSGRGREPQDAVRRRTIPILLGRRQRCGGHHLAGHPCRRRLLDTALVRAAGDLDETSISPERRPRVHRSPVGSPVLDPPADELDRVASERPLRLLRATVHAALVLRTTTRACRHSRGGDPGFREAMLSTPRRYEAIRGHSGHQRSSEVIRGTQRHCDPCMHACRRRCNRRSSPVQSGAIMGNHGQSGAIRGNQGQSGATDAHHLCNQGQSGAIRGNQGQPTLITCAKSE